MPGSEDRISALPDGVLQHLLGFLPVHDVVGTSVLAARWRHAWRSMRRLRISPEDGWDRPQHLKDFLGALLPERPGDHGSILQEARLDFDGLVEEDDAHVQVWIRRILSGQAQVLNVSFTTLGNPPLVSWHLRKLELTDMALEASILDFASCPALKDLTMAYCILSLDKISSQLVKCLSINGCDFLCDCRPSIATPNLVWLLLDFFGGRLPLLGSMPSLKTALVRPAVYSSDSCKGGDLGECYGSCAECTGDDEHSGRCLLLGGLSTAVNLELVAHTGMRIFGRNLRWCPTFSNLKTLLLNEWCVATDFHALLCILEHSPVLEKLTLRLSKRQEFITVLAGNCYPLEKLPAISEHLNTVEIRCRDIDGRVCRLLKFLS